MGTGNAIDRIITLTEAVSDALRDPEYEDRGDGRKTELRGIDDLQDKAAEAAEIARQMRDEEIAGELYPAGLAPLGATIRCFRLFENTYSLAWFIGESCTSLFSIHGTLDQLEAVARVIARKIEEARAKAQEPQEVLADAAG